MTKETPKKQSTLNQIDIILIGIEKRINNLQKIYSNKIENAPIEIQKDYFDGMYLLSKLKNVRN